jgi:hypothetical protein
MANENNKPETKPENEGPKPLSELDRLKLTNELAIKLSALLPQDRRLVLTSLATMLGVSSSTAQRTQQQRPPQTQQGRGRG